MAIDIKSLKNSAQKQLLTKLDALPGAAQDGTLTAKEAAKGAREMQRSSSLRAEAKDAFGAVPKNGAELTKFVGESPRSLAEARITGLAIAGTSQMKVAGLGKPVALGESDGKAMSISGRGEILRDGKAGTSLQDRAAIAYAAAKQATKLGKSSFADATRRRLFATLSDNLQDALKGKGSLLMREKLYAASMTLLVSLARATPKGPLKSAMLDRALQAVSQQRDHEMQEFYTIALRPFEKGLDAAQACVFTDLIEKHFPLAPPVDLWSKSRTKPIEARASIGEEFWHTDLRFYTQELGWKFTKNADDSERTYKGTLKDPTGRKQDLEVVLRVKKGDFDALFGLGEANVGPIDIGNHSNLGGFLSQSINDAPTEKGFPKAVLWRACRSLDGYYEFMSKTNRSHVTYSRGSTYSDPNNTLLRAYWETIAAGETYEWMRERADTNVFDEKLIDNYVYPDQVDRVLEHRDVDVDGQIDAAGAQTDLLFSPEKRKQTVSFMRALNFAETVLYWQDHDARDVGARPFFGTKFVEGLVPGGRIEDPRPGEIVRLTKAKVKDASGKERAAFAVAFDPADAKRDRDCYAGMVTASVMKALCTERAGELSPFDLMRSLVIGAQALHYLSVYSDLYEDSVASYCKWAGLPQIKSEDLDALYKKFKDSMVGDDITQAFIDLLKKKHGFDLAAFAKKNGLAANVA